MNKPIYKLKDWIDKKKLNNSGLSLNPLAIDYLTEHPELIVWDYLSTNANAISLLEKNKDKIYIDYLCRNESDETIILIKEFKNNITNWYYLNKNKNEKIFKFILENPDKINWYVFISNENSADFINNNLNFFHNNLKDFKWEALSKNTNPKILPLLKSNKNKLDWYFLSKNPLLFDVIKEEGSMYIHKINWSQLSLNEDKRAIALLKINKDKIDWELLSCNPYAIELLENNEDKIDWNYLSSNKNAIHLLENNKELIVWYKFSQNPSIFQLDYEKMKSNNQNMYEDLIKEVMKPSRVFKERDYDYLEVLFGDD